MQNIDITLKPSKQFLVFISALLLGSFMVIASLSLLSWIKIVLGLVLTGYGIKLFWCDILLRSRRSIIRLNKQNDGSWRLYDRKGAFTGLLAGDSTVTGFLCVLRFRVQGCFFKRSSLIFRDSVGADTYRKLLFRL